MNTSHSQSFSQSQEFSRSRKQSSSSHMRNASFPFRPGMEQRESSQPSKPKVHVPKLDLRKIIQNQTQAMNKNYQSVPQKKNTLSENMKEKDQSNFSFDKDYCTGNAIPVKPVSCFQDEFMSNIDEYSKSWREAAIQEQRTQNH